MSRRLLRVVRALLYTKPSQADALNGFVGSLVQTFENCRGGLTDAVLAEGDRGIATFFSDLYQKEIPRLRSVMQLSEPYLPRGTGEALMAEVDGLVRKVLIPGYVQLTADFTRKERNDFYLLKELHGLERFGWGLAGIALGVFAIRAPFIPLWADTWVLVLLLAGLFFPDLRRWLSIRRYEGELNRLVQRVDREIGRLDLAYLTTERLGEMEPSVRAVEEPGTPVQEVTQEGRERSRTRTDEEGTH